MDMSSKATNAATFSILFLSVIFNVDSACTKEKYCVNTYEPSLLSFGRIYWDLTQVPRDIPAESLSVCLKQNVITAIPDGVFSHLLRCQRLDLSYNHISSLRNLSFKGLVLLKYLDLGNNYVSFVEAKAFEELESLQTLNLGNNCLSTISQRIFKGLKHLRRLYLENNKISNIEKGAFFPLNSLQVVSLGSNKLETLDPNMFVNLLRPFYFGSFCARSHVWESLCWLRDELIHGSIYNFENVAPVCQTGISVVQIHSSFCSPPGVYFVKLELLHSTFLLSLFALICLQMNIG